MWPSIWNVETRNILTNIEYPGLSYLEKSPFRVIEAYNANKLPIKVAKKTLTSLWHSWNSPRVSQSFLFCEQAGTSTTKLSSCFKYMAALFCLCQFPSQKPYLLQVLKLFSKNLKAHSITSHYSLFPALCFDSVCLLPIVSNLSGFKSMSYLDSRVLPLKILILGFRCLCIF